jgi:hypothetical protein
MKRALAAAALLLVASPAVARDDGPPVVPFTLKMVDEGIPNVVDYDCTYGTRGNLAHFRIELVLQRNDAAQRTAIVGVTLWNQSDVPQTGLLQALATVLGAHGVPAPARRSLSLRLDSSTLGAGMTRLPNATFTSDPPGDWLVLKIFVPSRDKTADAPSFYLDINAKRGTGMIEPDDLNYGDALLTALATVL